MRAISTCVSHTIRVGSATDSTAFSHPRAVDRGRRFVVPLHRLHRGGLTGIRGNLCANLVPLADDVKVQVGFDPARVASYRLIDYENRALANEGVRDDGVDADEAGAGHAFTVAYGIVPAEAGDGAWLADSMRYRPACSTQHVEQALAMDASSAAAQPSDNWTFAAVIECGMTLRHSPFAGASTLEAPTPCWPMPRSPTNSGASKSSSPRSSTEEEPTRPSSRNLHARRSGPRWRRALRGAGRATPRGRRCAAS